MNFLFFIFTQAAQLTPTSHNLTNPGARAEHLNVSIFTTWVSYAGIRVANGPETKYFLVTQPPCCHTQH